MSITLLESAINRKPTDFEREFRKILDEKALEIMEEKKLRAAKSIYATESEVVSESDVDEDDVDFDLEDLDLEEEELEKNFKEGDRVKWYEPYSGHYEGKIKSPQAGNTPNDRKRHAEVHEVRKLGASAPSGSSKPQIISHARLSMHGE